MLDSTIFWASDFN